MSRLELPLVALRGLTVLPDMMIHFDLSREYSKNAVNHALNGEQQIFLVAQKDPDEEEISVETLYTVGTVAAVKQVTKLPNDIDRVMVEGVSKAKLTELALLEGTVHFITLLWNSRRRKNLNRQRGSVLCVH